jgi:hypothetical protein
MEARSAATVRSFDARKPSRGGVVDGRSAIAKRRLELFDIYSGALGGPAGLTEGQRIDIRRASELTALAESARAQAMREGFGDASQLSAMVRLESTAARAVRALGIKPDSGPKPPSIAEYAARKAAEKAASKPAGDPA